MNENRKAAYRALLYHAMIDIRMLCPPHDQVVICNPRVWFRWFRGYKDSRKAGGIADWLHNLAYASALDFADFDESRFWEAHKWICDLLPDDRLELCREHFEYELSRFAL